MFSSQLQREPDVRGLQSAWEIYSFRWGIYSRASWPKPVRGVGHTLYSRGNGVGPLAQWKHNTGSWIYSINPYIRQAIHYPFGEAPGCTSVHVNGSLAFHFADYCWVGEKQTSQCWDAWLYCVAETTEICLLWDILSSVVMADELKPLWPGELVMLRSIREHFLQTFWKNVFRMSLSELEKVS